jgi:signal transduction histidine kinase
MLTEMTRFNEAVDQALAESVARYSDEVARSRDTFLAILGHDLRSPLSAVSMSAHYLTIPGRVQSEGQPALARIKQSVLTMSLMIKDLLEYTRTRLGQGIPVTPLAATSGTSAKPRTTRCRRRTPTASSIWMSGDLRAQIDLRGSDRYSRICSTTPSSTARKGCPSTCRLAAKRTSS